MTKEEALKILDTIPTIDEQVDALEMAIEALSAEDCTAMKQEFIRMAEYIDMFLECSDEQKETLIGFISRLAEFMPWTERD